LIAGTRVALGIGIGLLLSNRFNKDQRNAAGWALVGVGILTTIPIALGVQAFKGWMLIALGSKIAEICVWPLESLDS
jgi:hypothetical protein